MGVLAVRKSVAWACDRSRRDRGPALIEAKTYRVFHQQGQVSGSAYGYRSKEEEDAWRARDPILRFPEKLIALGHADRAFVDSIDSRASKAVDAAAAPITETEPGANRLRIVPSLWTAPASDADGDLASVV